MSILKLLCIGNLGQDARISNVNGKQVINFSMAHTEKFRSGDEQKEKTTWLDCAYWSDSKVGQYLTKGTQVYIEGQPDVRTWEKDGKSGAALSVRVFTVQLLGGKQQGESQPAQQQQAPTNDSKPVDDDSLPF